MLAVDRGVSTSDVRVLHRTCFLPLLLALSGLARGPRSLPLHTHLVACDSS